MTPDYLTPGAARITQDRYTHMLTGKPAQACRDVPVYFLSGAGGLGVTPRW